MSNGVVNNLIAQIDVATGEIVRKLDPKPNMDDDPAGIAFPPLGWTGSLLSREQALCIDMGYGGPRGLWRISLDGSEPEQIARNANDLDSPIDLTITRSEVYTINRMEARMGTLTADVILDDDYCKRIYRFEDDVFVPIRTDRPIFDPHASDLLVLCGQRLEDPMAKRVLRVRRYPDEDLYRVTDVFSGFNQLTECGIDIAPDGQRIAISDSGAGAIYVFKRTGPVD